MSAPTESPIIERPVLHRLLHATAEVVVSLVMAGGLWMIMVQMMCLDSYRCDDMGGIVYWLASAFIAMIVWSGFMSLCGRYRHRLVARRNLDIAAVLLTIVSWIGYFLLA
jgi:sterol desaturase/sphingolipid hydroxylase (fatty acid hydroxylase superfamily)